MFFFGVEESSGSRDLAVGDAEYLLKFPLTNQQKIVSSQIQKEALHQDVLVDAVCGAGKTELVLETIKDALLLQKKVGWAIPRRQVVLELKERLAMMFPDLCVIAVCQGYTQITDGDLILCTTHQLYRYRAWFDLLILDEPDAFPYKGNSMLEHFANKSCVGNIIYLTATPDEHLLRRVEQGEMSYVQLNARPHGYPLIEPSVRIIPASLCLFLLYVKIQNARQWLIFVPTRNIARWLSLILRSDCITSESDQKEEIIERFRRKERRLLVATTILERGVTFADIDVVVLFSDHPVFDVASLIQISGRVGRSFLYPKGECLFLSRSKTSAVMSCIRKIRKANQSVFGV